MPAETTDATAEYDTESIRDLETASRLREIADPEETRSFLSLNPQFKDRILI